jgi:RHS repeat-associated protein
MDFGRQRSGFFTGRAWRGLSLWLAAVTAVSMVTAVAGPAEAAGTGPVVEHMKPLPHSDFPLQNEPAPKSPPDPPHKPASWPAAGDADVDLTQARVDHRTADPAAPPGKQRAAGLPVLLGAGAGRAHVRVTDQDAAQRAGVAGVLLSVTPATDSPGVSSVGVDYSGFGDSVGAGFGSRLRLVSLPGCALTDPGKPECRVQSPLPSTNDPATHVVTAELASQQQKSAPMVLAAVAGSGGSQGQFTASSLSPSGSWSVSGASGGFSWSYPITVPPAATGSDVAPGVGLSYSAASVDGRTAATNNQDSSIGQGWDYSPGYVERSYRTCAEDTTLPKAQQTGDECWAGHVVTLNLGGGTTALVRDDATQTWKAQADDGSRVDLLPGAANGAHDGEYWRITKPDGIQYFFGHSPDAASTWTVPVYGPHVGDPCHSDTFAQASCAQAWRWNLDYVVDTHGNATAYYYNTETNYYGANNGTAGVLYVRAGVLKRIDYGLRDTGGGIGGQTAPRQVTFDTNERCDPAVNPKVNCADPAQMTTANALSWPDVPVDQKCAQTDTCNNHAPTFWFTRKVTTITTWYNTGSAPVKVDSYALGQSLPGPGSGDRELRLDSITRTGFAPNGTSIALPPVSFTSQLMDNRVFGYNNMPAMAHWRLTNIATDTGSKINVTYSKAECTKTNVPADPSTDDKLCYPIKWTPPFFTAPILDYFHKYVTTQVKVQDSKGVSPDQITSYTYLGKPAWHFDDNEIVKPANRSYGQFRGYFQVEVRTGNTVNMMNTVPDTLTLTRTTYFRGMDGDTLPNNGTRAATVPDSLGEVVADNNLYADQARETQSFNGDGGAQLATTIIDPITIGTTATRARTGLPALTATILGTGQTRTFTTLTTGGTRAVSSRNSYDPVGRVVAATSSGDGVPDLCTTTSYADNTTTWVRGNAKQLVTSQQACPTDGSKPSPILSDIRTYYDGSDTLGEVTLGDPSRTDTATSNDNGNLTVATIARATVDAAGRPVSVTDANGNITTTAYTPADGGILSQTVATNPKNQTIITQFEPSRGNTITGIDIAGHRSDGVYDPLGRLTAVWKPGQTKDFDDPATATYDYLVRTDGPLAVTSHTLVDYGPATNYVTTVSLYDSMGQLRQAQTDAEGGGRVVKDVFYDSHGWAGIANNRYYTDGAPATTMVAVADSAVDDRTITTFDGSGRAVVNTAYRGKTATWNTRTVYGGDRTTVLPPQGGVPSTTVVDARGHTVELDQYTTPPVVDGNSNISGGAPQVTKYHYTPTGLQDSITDTKNVTWTYQYDFLGRKISQTDPDTGTSATSYDLLGQVVSTTDARNQTLSYDYDELGRRTAEHDGPRTGPKLAEWIWDTLQAGKLSSSVRHTPGGDYVTAVTSYDGKGRPNSSLVTIPSSEIGLDTSYLTEYSFTRTDLPTMVHPAHAGGLPDEILHTSYDKLGKPQNLQGNFDYVASTTYTPYGETAQYRLSSLNSSASLTYTYDPQTRRLTGQNLSAQTADPQVSDLHYTYDPAGNPIKTVESRGQTGGIRTQCYQYDPLDRLSQAWTATDNCTTTPTTTPGAANIGGPSPYWTSWSFEPGGLRTQQVKHALPGATGDTTTTYAYPGGATQPHTLTSTSTSSPVGANSTSYTYDKTGNTLTRAVPSGNQTLTWDQENRLSTVTTPAGQTSYIYDADGGQLIRHDPGKTTLYLPGEELVRDNNTGVVMGTRYYSHNGTVVALRVGGSGASSNPKYLLSDPHGSGQVTVSSVGFAVTRRDFDPYGNVLGAVQGGPWPDQHGFLGKPQDDATGLTDIGARDYDPTTGRFISADPVLDPASPGQLNGYTYAGNNPITNSDPSGLYLIGGEDDLGNQYGISYAGGQETVIGSPKAVRGYGTTMASGKKPCGSRGSCGPGEQWKADNSPKTNNPDRLIALFEGWSVYNGFGMGTNRGGSYWQPQTGEDGKPSVVCFGRTACEMALEYLNQHKGDVAGAKEIAATYCLHNMDRCRSDANAFQLNADFDYTGYLALGLGLGTIGARAPEAGTAAVAGRGSVPRYIFRTGSQTENALTDASGVSFRDSVSSAADGTQTLRPGDKIWAIDTQKLPEGSVEYDGGSGPGHPAGHVSVYATPDQIKAATVPDFPGNPLNGLKQNADGTWRLPK